MHREMVGGLDTIQSQRAGGDSYGPQPGDLYTLWTWCGAVVVVALALGGCILDVRSERG